MLSCFSFVIGLNALLCLVSSVRCGCIHVLMEFKLFVHLFVGSLAGRPLISWNDTARQKDNDTFLDNAYIYKELERGETIHAGVG